MIKLKLREVIAASNALAAMPRVRAKPAYDLARVRDKLKPEVRAYAEQERALIEAHGGAIKDDGKIAWPAPTGGEEPPDVVFKRERDELLDKEIEIDRNPVKLSEILGTDEAKQPEIEPELLSILEKIIVE